MPLHTCHPLFALRWPATSTSASARAIRVAGATCTTLRHWPAFRWTSSTPSTRSRLAPPSQAATRRWTARRCRPTRRGRAASISPARSSTFSRWGLGVEFGFGAGVGGRRAAGSPCTPGHLAGRPRAQAPRPPSLPRGPGPNHAPPPPPLLTLPHTPRPPCPTFPPPPAPPPPPRRMPPGRAHVVHNARQPHRVVVVGARGGVGRGGWRGRRGQALGPGQGRASQAGTNPTLPTPLPSRSTR